MILIGWIVIGIIATRLYKKKLEKPVVWKVIVVTLIGLFTFSFNWKIFDRAVQISILPLGVWILYALLSKNKAAWQKYRQFVWLGFMANYIFLIFLLVGVLVSHLLYPGNNLSTYISSVEDAYIINTHPTAKESSLVKKDLIASIKNAKPQEILSISWYNETVLEENPEKRKERFPYMLTNTLPMWGSGLNPTIYIEKNGKGILITTQEKQLYFQTEHSLIEEGDK